MNPQVHVGWRHGFWCRVYQGVSWGAKLIVLVWLCEKAVRYICHLCGTLGNWPWHECGIYKFVVKLSVWLTAIWGWIPRDVDREACAMLACGAIGSVFCLVASNKFLIGIQNICLSIGKLSCLFSQTHMMVPEPAGKDIPIESDSPIHEPERDNLGRSAYVDILKRLILGAAKTSENHATYIGVYGEWGAGKTTVRNFLEAHFKAAANDKKAIFVDFCPWEYEEKCDLRLELYKKLDGAVKRVTKGKPVRVFSQLVKLATWRSPERVSGVLGEFLDIFRDFWFTVVVKEEKLLETVKDVLREIGKTTRIIVVVDDLDRVTPAEARRVVRFLKANGDLPNLVYLILADEKYLANAVAGMPDNPPPGGAEYGREYLRKIVGIRCPLPTVSHPYLVAHFEKKLQALVEAYGLRWDDETHACEWVAGCLHTLRDMKLFLNEFSLTLANLKQRAGDGTHLGIHLGDLLAVIALWSWEPELYGHLQSIYSIIMDAYSPWHKLSESAGIPLKKMEDCCYKFVRPGGREQVDVFLKDRLNIGPVEFDGNSHKPVRYGLTASEGPETISRCRLASEFHFDTYFHFDNERSSNLDEGLDDFKQRVLEGTIPETTLVKLADQGLWPQLIGSLSGTTDWPPPTACGTYVRTLVHMAGMPRLFEGDSDPIGAALYRCLNLYAKYMNNGTFSETLHRRRVSLRSTWTSAFLDAVRAEDDVQMSAHFIAWEEYCRSERGSKDEVLFDEDGCHQLKEGYLKRIEKFHNSGKLVKHPEFLRLFSCWVNGVKDGNHLQEFRDAFAKDLRNANSVWQILGLFLDRRYLEEDLGTYPIQSKRLEEAFGNDGMEKMAGTLGALADEEGTRGTTARLLQWVVGEKKAGRPYDEQTQSNHLLAEMEALKARKKG